MISDLDPERRAFCVTTPVSTIDCAAALHVSAPYVMRTVDAHEKDGSTPWT